MKTGKISSQGQVNGENIDTIEQNIYLNAYRIAVNGALTNFNMVNGVVDEFEDESGVDTANSTNEDYDSDNDLYSPTDNYGSDVTSDSYTHYALNTASGGYTPDNISDDALDWAVASHWNSDVVTNQTVGIDFGAGVTKTITKLRLYLPNANEPTMMPKNFILQGANSPSSTTEYNATGWTDLVSAQTTYNIGGWEDFAFSNSTAYRYYRLKIADNWGHASALVVQEWELLEGGMNNMTLISNSITAEAQPDTIKGLMVYKPIDSVTLNTDLKLYFTRDGGTTWTQATLSSVGNLDNGKVMLVGEADVSSQPSGTSLGYKIVTDNNKGMEIHSMEYWYD